MSNSLYQSLNQNGFMSMLNALKANPIQFLLQRKLRLPQNFQGSPEDIVQYLLNTGQVTQEQVNALQRRA